MKTVEELKKKQEEEMLKLTKEIEIAGKMPFPPKMTMYFGERAPWVTYSRETLPEAIEVFKAFNVVPMVHGKGAYCHLCPESEITSERGEVQHLGDYCAAIDVDQGEGFGPNVTLKFYAQTQVGVVRVGVDLEGKTFSRDYNWKWRAEVEEGRDHRGRLIRRDFQVNRVLNGLRDGVISWATGDIGPIKTSARITYMWVADDQECTQFTHFFGQMENLAGEMY